MIVLDTGVFGPLEFAPALEICPISVIMIKEDFHMTTAEIEDRLAAVEREVAMLKSRASIPPINSDVPPKHPVHTLDQIHGIFEDDDAFREAMRLGREWRESARPKPRRRVGKRK